MFRSCMHAPRIEVYVQQALLFFNHYGIVFALIFFAFFMWSCLFVCLIDFNAPAQQAVPVYQVFIKTVLIERLSHFPDIGIIFSNNLSWSHHSKSVVFNALKTLHLLCRVICMSVTYRAQKLSASWNRPENSTETRKGLKHKKTILLRKSRGYIKKDWKTTLLLSRKLSQPTEVE